MSFIPAKIDLLHFRCNSNIDCADGSDEKDCDDHDKQEKCQENQYLCRDGTCIDTENLCDGFEVKQC